MDRIQILKKAIQIEFNETKSRYSNNKGIQNIKERTKEGLALYPLLLQKHQFSVKENPVLTFSSNVNQEMPFRKGDLVQLIDAENYIRGILSDFDHGQLTIDLSTEEIPEWIFETEKIGLVPAVDDRSFSEMDFALNKILSKENERLNKIYKEIFYNQPQHLKSELKNYSNPKLNTSQSKAVESIVNSDSVALVHGPPGTGKTTTLIEAVKELIYRKKKVLVTAPSNAAVDHFFGQIKGLNSLRIGRINNTLDQKILESSSYKLIKSLKKQASEAREKAGKWKRNFSKEDREERKKLYHEAKILRKEIRSLQNHIETKFIEQAAVICTTLIGSSNKLLKNTHFDFVFIDEAGQSLEPACWVAASKGDTLILCGDHQQLPPTILSNGARKDLEKSLLEIASEKIENLSFLDTQYRMQPEIVGFSNHYFYNNQLKTEVKKQEKEAFFKLPFEFIDTAGTGFNEEENENSSGFYNSGEIQVIEKLLEQNDTLIKEEIALISPYRFQVEKLSEVFPKLNVNTIDSFQGQEKKIVIISLVRSNENGTIGFLKDYRRMNVAMTRAQNKLIVIGDSATIGNDSFYSKMLEYVEEIGGYRSAFELIY